MSRPEEHPLGLVEQELALYPPGVMLCSPSEEKTEKNEKLLRVETPLIHPGGTPIHVYVRSSGRNGYVVTDLGRTTRMLGRQLDTDTSSERRWSDIARRICHGLEVNLQQREWTVQAKTPREVGQAVMLLAQAQLRTAIVAATFKIATEEQRR